MVSIPPRKRAKATASSGTTGQPASGHAKLKQALVLRDFLASRLGLRLRDAQNYLNDAEGRHGAVDAFGQQHYLHSALGAASAHGRSLLVDLDTQVKQACQAVGLVPRYFQYLALLFAAHWFNRLLGNTDHLLAELNAFHAHWQSEPGRPTVAPFALEDLQCAALWMATAAGKTHLLHACLALLAKRRFPDGGGFERLILITPSESLSRQHADALRAHTHMAVFVYPDDGDARAIAEQPSDTMIVIDINKLAETKKGTGLTVDASVFADARNLVFVDEGHKGQRSEASVWKRIQANMAGVGQNQPKYRGWLIEFSATFGQVAEAEHAFDRYAKAVLFDYAYDRFHADLYGKDFSVRDLETESGWDHHADALVVALVAYWHQLHAWRTSSVQAELHRQGLQVEQPLWVLLGLSVVGGKKEEEAEYRSDIIEVLRFVKQLLAEDGLVFLAEYLQRLAGDDGELLLPKSAWDLLKKSSPTELAALIRHEVFGYEPGATLTLRALKSSRGELGVGLSLADHVRYFGVINVGDSDALKTALEPYGLVVEPDAFTPSLFSALDRPGSSLNLLIGSRRFSEGWNNYRASSLTLLRLGSGEGPLIVQMFGRVVRFRGRNGDGKRLANPGVILAPLQTAYVYGLRADYMKKFLKNLEKNDIDKRIEVFPTVRVASEQLGRLLHLSAHDPDKRSYSLAAVGRSRWFDASASVRIALGVTVQRTQMRDGRSESDIQSWSTDIKQDFLACVGYLNFDRILREMLIFRASNGWWNVRFDHAGLREALQNGRYTLEGTVDTLQLQSRNDLQRIEGIAITVLQRMLRSAYRRAEAKQVAYKVEPLRPDNDMLVDEVFVRNDI